jgi:uncharacterized protein (TIGR02145 family)
MTACPVGWHLPSDAEWATLVNYVGGSSTAGTKLKSTTGWDYDYGTDNYGFSALPGGLWIDGIFGQAGGTGYWWSATERDADNAYYRSMGYMHSSDNSKTTQYSVRCVQD